MSEHNYNSILEYWMNFFPELENRSDLVKLLSETSKSNLEELELKWKDLSEDTNYKNFVDDILSYNQIDSEISEIIEVLSRNNFSYINFISPILFYTLRKKKYEFTENKVIHNKSIFLHNLISDCYTVAYNIFIKTIILEINIATENNWLKGETPEARANYFKYVLLKNNDYINEVYLEYPSLVKLLISTLENYINYVYGIIEATESEMSSLETFFECSLGNVLNLETSFGDSHNGGKTVAVINFTTGVKLVLKPRNMILESKFNQFIELINKSTDSNILDLRYAKVYNTKKFSWMEYIEYKSCNTVQEVKNFYKRIGQFLCILYSLNARDFHHENLIAIGENPVLIDLEALLHVEKQNINNDSVHDLALSIIEDSVYSIYLLPTRSLYSENEGKVNTFDIGGLGASERQLSPFRTPKIINNDTDRIRIKKDYNYVDVESNNPRLYDEIINSEDYIDEIQEGFFNMYKWMLKNKKIYLSTVKELFSRVMCRVIIKPTFLYSELLSISYHPDLLRNPIHREVFFNRIGIARSFIDSKDISFSEYTDLLSGDVPYFSINSSEFYLRNSSNEIIPDSKLKKSPLEIVIQKINSLNLDDLKFQKRIIDFTFMHTAEGANTGIGFEKTNNFSETANRQEYLDISMKIADKMIKDSIYNSEGTEQTWFGLMIIGKEEVLTRFSSIEYDLYKGNSGIALFFAYLAIATGEEKYKESALRVIKSCVDLLESLDEYSDEDKDIGAFTGISGVIYAVFYVGEILGINKFKDIAYKSTNYLVKDIKSNNEFDIISGCSGALAVLLSLYEKTTDAEIKASLMINCNIIAEHIINNITKYEDMLLWGQYGKNEGYTGFAHGTSGITSTLIRYYSHSKDPRIHKIINGTLRFESHLFSSETNNWKLSIQDNAKSVAWCHGASGILLNRSLLLKYGYENKEDIMTDIKYALETVIEHGFGFNYILCHGDTGNLSSIYQLAEVMNDEELKKYCDSTLDSLFNKYVKNNWDQNTFRSANMYGLMIGLAGLGYFMLKYGCNQDMPNLLWLE